MTKHLGESNEDLGHVIPSNADRDRDRKGEHDKMNETHPNIALLTQFDTARVAETSDILSEDFVWHFFNPHLTDIQGDHVGREGLEEFFMKMHERTGGTFKVKPVSATAVGDELVVVQTINTMVFEGQAIELDAVIVWRIIDGSAVEAWDIPAVNSVRAKR